MFSKKSMEELGRLHTDEAANAGKYPMIIILDDIRSMHNVGSVFRTCDAFAAKALFLCGYTPAPPHRDINKTALGATETVTWKHFQNVSEAISEVKERGYKVYAVEQVHNSIMLDKFGWNRQDGIALVLGNEVTGVSEQALALSDGCIEIPQWGTKHSLNISVTAGIVMWEMVRG